MCHCAYRPDITSCEVLLCFAFAEVSEVEGYLLPPHPDVEGPITVCDTDGTNVTVGTLDREPEVRVVLKWKNNFGLQNMESAKQLKNKALESALEQKYDAACKSADEGEPCKYASQKMTGEERKKLLAEHPEAQWLTFTLQEWAELGISESVNDRHYVKMRLAQGGVIHLVPKPYIWTSNAAQRLQLSADEAPLYDAMRFALWRQPSTGQPRTRLMRPDALGGAHDTPLLLQAHYPHSQGLLWECVGTTAPEHAEQLRLPALSAVLHAKWSQETNNGNKDAHMMVKLSPAEWEALFPADRTVAAASDTVYISMGRLGTSWTASRSPPQQGVPLDHEKPSVVRLLAELRERQNLEFTDAELHEMGISDDELSQVSVAASALPLSNSRTA